MRVEIKHGIDQAAGWFRQVVAEHVFQTFEVLKAVETAERRQFCVQVIKRPWRILTAFPRFKYYAVWEEDRLLLLAPFKIQGNVAHVLGDGCEINYCDFLMSDDSHEVQKKAICCLFNELKKHGVRAMAFRHLARTSRVWAVLQELDYSLEGVRTSKSVRIDFKCTNHASYFSSLGKHARQNVRTAYNRLMRDAHDIELKLFSNCGHWLVLDSLEGRDFLRYCHQMYVERQSHVYGLGGG